MKPLLLLVSVLLLGCAGLPKLSPRNLVGEWRYTDQTQSCHYAFEKNGTFSGEVAYQGKILSRFKGRWKVEKNVLLYQYTADALHRIPVGSRDRDKLLVVKPDHFVIEAADGSQRRYLRIK